MAHDHWQPHNSTYGGSGDKEEDVAFKLFVILFVTDFSSADDKLSILQAFGSITSCHNYNILKTLAKHVSNIF